MECSYEHRLTPTLIFRDLGDYGINEEKSRIKNYDACPFEVDHSYKQKHNYTAKARLTLPHLSPYSNVVLMTLTYSVN